MDLGWGQADGTLTEASFAKMCMAELEKTLEKSLPITNMLIFLTDKYGSPGLPPYVNREEFELILSGIEDEDARGLVKRWYCLDENAVPPAYRLQAVPAGPTLIAPGLYTFTSLHLKICYHCQNIPGFYLIMC